MNFSSSLAPFSLTRISLVDRLDNVANSQIARFRSRSLDWIDLIRLISLAYLRRNAQDIKWQIVITPATQTKAKTRSTSRQLDSPAENWNSEQLKLLTRFANAIDNLLVWEIVNGDVVYCQHTVADSELSTVSGCVN